MEINGGLPKKIKIGEFGYVNRTCWLARNVNSSPSRRCQFCKSKFKDCLFYKYLTITVILVVLLSGATFLLEKSFPKSVVVSIFVLVITYGYFFDRSTEAIIEANFEQGKAKDALEDLTKNLQQKVDDQTKELRAAYDVEKRAKEELEALGKVKNQFLMTVQHHLRTPLTSMMGYSDLLLDGTFGKVPKKIRDVIERFEGSTSSLIKMVNEFLDITQFQLGKDVLHLKGGVNLCPIFLEIFRDIELETKEKGLYLKLEKPEGNCTIKADEPKLKAALTNIFDNAVKYTKEGGITIRLEVEGKTVKVEIKDTGIGISKEGLAKLFDITFERGEEAKKNFATGRGIGLYLSGQIIKAHNGRIWAESEGEGKGSTFYIELPIEKLIEYKPIKEIYAKKSE